MIDVFIKRGNLDTDVHIGESHVKMKVKISVMQQNPRHVKDSSDHQKLAKSGVTDSPSWA
jgi:hypothetical protein